MNRKRARELLPVIQAFAEGKTIQYRDNSRVYKWSDADNEIFLLNTDNEYRIKPEPREFWIFYDLSQILDSPPVCGPDKYFKVREVTDE